MISGFNLITLATFWQHNTNYSIRRANGFIGKPVRSFLLFSGFICDHPKEVDSIHRALSNTEQIIIKNINPDLQTVPKSNADSSL